MADTLFALFDDPGDAAQAKADLESMITVRGPCDVILHDRQIDEVPASELALFESCGAYAPLRVALIGGVGGAILGGLIAGPIGFLGHFTWETYAFVASACVIMGAMVGAIAGPSEANPALTRLSRHVTNGRVLLTVHAESTSDRDHGMRILTRHHARSVRNAVG